ncbi:MAG: PilN domain-containing protein [Desulfobacterales bacterium]|nr:PilN domain-containing protein [Desulfobacterales bacterium]
MNRINLNLATTEYYDRKSAYPALAAALLILLLLSIFNVHLYTRNRAEIREYERKISHLESQAAKGQAKREPAPAVSKTEIDSIKERVVFVNRLIEMDSFPWDRFLDELESRTPSDILILRFTTTRDSGRFRIEGKAGSMKEVTEFLKGMERSTVFRNSNLLSVSTLKETDRKETSGGVPAIRFEIETRSAIEPPFIQG